MKACYICTFMNTYKHKPAQHVVKRAACCSVLLQCVGFAKRKRFEILIGILRFSNHGLIISPNACSRGICGQPQAACMRPIFGRDSTSVEYSSFWVAVWLLLYRVVAHVQVCCVFIFFPVYMSKYVCSRLVTNCYSQKKNRFFILKQNTCVFFVYGVKYVCWRLVTVHFK